MAVELTGGQIRYSFNSGDGPQTLLSRTTVRPFSSLHPASRWVEVLVFPGAAVERLRLAQSPGLPGDAL